MAMFIFVGTLEPVDRFHSRKVRVYYRLQSKRIRAYLFYQLPRTPRKISRLVTIFPATSLCQMSNIIHVKKGLVPIDLFDMPSHIVSIPTYRSKCLHQTSNRGCTTFPTTPHAHPKKFPSSGRVQPILKKLVSKLPTPLTL